MAHEIKRTAYGCAAVFSTAMYLGTHSLNNFLDQVIQLKIGRDLENVFIGTTAYLICATSIPKQAKNYPSLKLLGSVGATLICEYMGILDGIFLEDNYSVGRKIGSIIAGICTTYALDRLFTKRKNIIKKESLDEFVEN